MKTLHVSKSARSVLIYNMNDKDQKKCVQFIIDKYLCCEEKKRKITRMTLANWLGIRERNVQSMLNQIKNDLLKFEKEIH
jgi:hypothetical protein